MNTTTENDIAELKELIKNQNYKLDKTALLSIIAKVVFWPQI